MSEELQQRATEATERLLEDESLTGDLNDAQAKPLIKWLTQETQRIALNEKLSDDEVKADLKKLRAAAVFSCQHATEEINAEAIIANIQQNIAPTKKMKAIVIEAVVSSQEPVARTEERQDAGAALMAPSPNNQNILATIDKHKALTQQDPTDMFAWLKLGDLYARAGNQMESANAYAEAAKLVEEAEPEKALQLFRVIQTLNPSYPALQEHLDRLSQKTSRGEQPETYKELLQPKQEERVSPAEMVLQLVKDTGRKALELLQKIPTPPTDEEKP